MNKLQADGWILESAKTEATITRAWPDEKGEISTFTEDLIGTPQEVKKMTAPNNKNEIVEINCIHTIEKWSRTTFKVTTSGRKKGRETQTIEVDGYGSGAVPNNGTGLLGYDLPGSPGLVNKTIIEKDLEKIPQWLSERLKNIEDWIKQHNNWLITIGIGTGIAIALGASALIWLSNLV